MQKEKYYPRAKSVFDSNEDMQVVHVCADGNAFPHAGAAENHANVHKLKTADSKGWATITRAEVYAEPKQAEEKKDDAPKALYTDPQGKVFNTNKELAAEAKARELVTADKKNDTLIAALVADDEAKAKAAAEGDADVDAAANALSTEPAAPAEEK